jgi:hypothetical protein
VCVRVMDAGDSDQWPRSRYVQSCRCNGGVDGLVVAVTHPSDTALLWLCLMDAQAVEKETTAHLLAEQLQRQSQSEDGDDVHAA